MNGILANHPDTVVFRHEPLADDRTIPNTQHCLGPNKT